MAAWATPAVKPIELLPSLPTGARILLVRLRRLGDMVLSTSLFAALKNWRPDLRLTVLAESPNDEVVRNNPDLDDVIMVPTTRKSVLSTAAAQWRLLEQIRTAGFDCCLNLHGGPRSAWLTAWSGARYRAGGRNFRNRLTCNVIVHEPPEPPGSQSLHTLEKYIRFLYKLGLPQGPIPLLRIVPDPVRRQVALGKLQDAGLDPGRDYAVIQPAAKFATKEWHAEGFAAVADEIRTKYGLQVAIIAGPGEESKAEQVATQSRSSPVVVRGVSVAELVWVIQGARLFVGNDSGPTHIASALNIPIVVLYGSSDSRAWFPWNTKSPCRIVQNNFACNPCPGYRCLVYDKPRCILSITPEQVNAAVAAQLRFSTRPR